MWFPDSALKTAQAIEEYDREQLPLVIMANWRGFSGGQRDLFEGVLQVCSAFQLLPWSCLSMPPGHSSLCHDARCFACMHAERIRDLLASPRTLHDTPSLPVCVHCAATKQRVLQSIPNIISSNASVQQHLSSASSAATHQAGAVILPKTLHTSECCQDMQHPSGVTASLMQAGSLIVDNLRTYRQPVIVYLPPGAELRGGAWVVIDGQINPAQVSTLVPSGQSSLLLISLAFLSSV